jgi:phosphomevalonate decarboxylase
VKATATAHPIQGLVKYHGMRDEALRHPYHDSISVCTAPSRTLTTVAFGAAADLDGDDGDAEADRYEIDGEVVEGRGAERIAAVLDEVRARAGLDAPARVVSENSFPSNVGFGSSSSGFAALAVAAVEAAGLDLTAPETSAVARRGSSSAARAVTGAFSQLHAGANDADCRSERLTVADDLADDLRIVTALVPAYKETEEAHREAAASHMFDARMAHVHGQIADMRDALRAGDFDRAFDLAERDSLSLAATTMTGPAGWVYWQPDTIAVFNAIRRLRDEGVPAYFSVDTGASVYVNTTVDHVDAVEAAVADVGVDTEVWTVGGPAEVRDGSEALF